MHTRGGVLTAAAVAHFPPLMSEAAEETQGVKGTGTGARARVVLLSTAERMRSGLVERMRVNHASRALNSLLYSS